MLTYMFQAITVAITVFSLVLALKWFKIAKTYEPMAKQLATMLGKSGSKKRWATRDKTRVEETKNKAIKNIIASIPMAPEILKKIKLTNEEAFLLMTDEDIAPKIYRMIQIAQKTFGKGEKLINNLILTEKKKKSLEMP